MVSGKQNDTKVSKSTNMELIRLTQQNAAEYIGYEILFKSRGIYIVKKILGVTNTSVKINHSDLHNTLQIVSRKVYVLME